MRRPIYHPSAEAEARSLVAKHDGDAVGIVERKLGERLSSGDVDKALYLDQVRRAVERVEAAALEVA